jgi:hypothetical protein
MDFPDTHSSSRSSGSGTKPAASIKIPAEVESYNRMVIQTIGDNLDYPITATLPIPVGLPIADNLAYGSTNMNQVGSIAQDALSNGIPAAIENAKASANNAGDTTTKAAVLAQIASKSGGIGTSATDAISDAILYNKRTLLNPNQRTTFSGSNTRSYSLEFKLVAQSAKESNDIRELVKRLQYNAYPAGNALVLKYPSEFKISVLSANSKDYNRYYSPIYNCFLMNISTVYNASGNSFYSDGAPLDVSLTLGFQETKALTRNDLEKLYRDNHRDSY